MPIGSAGQSNFLFSIWLVLRVVSFFGGARSQGLNLHGAVLEKTEAIWRAFNLLKFRNATNH